MSRALTTDQRAFLSVCASATHNLHRARGPKNIAHGRRLVALGLLSEPWAKSARPGCGVFFSITDAGRVALAQNEGT